MKKLLIVSILCNFLLIFLLLNKSSVPEVIKTTVGQLPFELSEGSQKYEEGYHPKTRIGMDKIKVYKSKVLINEKEIKYGTVKGTNSMLPLIYKGATVLYKIPESEEDIKVGDIVVFRTKRGYVIHRIVDKSRDEKGVYYITKGDNNRFRDGYKIRFENIVYVVVGVIY